jgi:transposase-like protein
MRNSKTCPKCKSTDIVRIPGKAGGYGSDKTNILIGWTVFNVVKVTRFLCASCGFIEHWVESAEDLATVKKKYGS